MMECVSCGQEFSGTFCPNCGEKGGDRRLTAQTIVGSTFSSLLNMDKGLLYNLKHLTIAPRQMVRQYLSGKRRGIFNPVSYSILTISLYLVVESQLGTSSITVDPGSIQKTESFSTGYAVGKFMRQSLKYFWLFYILMLSAGTKIFFQQFNFVEHLAANSFIVGHATLVAIILFPVLPIQIMLNPVVYLTIWVLVMVVFGEPDEKWRSALVSVAAVIISFILFFLIPSGTFALLKWLF